MLAKLWNHYPQEAKSPEAWKLLTDDFLAHLGRYPVAVIERAIERGQREWEYRPTIAHMVEQCDRAARDMPRPEPQGDDWKRNTKGGYTVWRRKELADAWFASHRALIEEAKAGDWFFSLYTEVQDGANILAQTEWEQRQNPSWKPPPWHQENLLFDPVRGWEIFISQEKLKRWRSARNAPIPIKGHAFRGFGDALEDAVKAAETARGLE